MNILKALTSSIPCRVSVVSGVITGKGTYQLKTPLGVETIRLPWTINKIGPAEIYNDFCSSLIYLQPTIHFAWIFPALILISLSILLPCFLRLPRLIKHLKEFDYKPHYSWSGLKMSGPMGKRRISYWRIFLYCYFCLPYATDGCILTSRFIGNHSLFFLNAMSGEVICTKGATIRIPLMESSANLVFQYESAIWAHERSAEWGCATGSCPSIEDCQNLRQETSLKVKDRSITRSFCSNYPRACAFGRGCWYGQDLVRLGDKVKIYDVPESKILATDVTDNHCQIGLIGGNHLHNENFKVALFRDNYYLCKYASDRLKPVMGTVGDIQVLDDSYLFDWDAIKCDEDWFSNKSCKLIKPDIMTQCQKFPFTMGPVEYKINDNTIQRLVTSYMLSIAGTCKEDFVEKAEACFETELTLVGVQHSGLELSLAAKSFSINLTGTLEIDLNCTTLKHITLPCDGHFHFFEINDVESCKGITNLTKIMSNFGVVHKIDSVSHPILQMRLHDEHTAHLTTLLLIVILIMAIFCTCIRH